MTKKDILNSHNQEAAQPGSPETRLLVYDYILPTLERRNAHEVWQKILHLINLNLTAPCDEELFLDHCYIKLIANENNSGERLISLFGLNFSEESIYRFSINQTQLPEYYQEQIEFGDAENPHRISRKYNPVTHEVYYDQRY